MVPGTNLSPKLAILTEIFCSFPQPLYVNAGYYFKRSYEYFHPQFSEIICHIQLLIWHYTTCFVDKILLPNHEAKRVEQNLRFICLCEYNCWSSGLRHHSMFWSHTNTSENCTASISVPKMEAVCSSRTLVYILTTARHNNITAWWIVTDYTSNTNINKTKRTWQNERASSNAMGAPMYI
jgi:hypothetical protein